MSDEYFTLLVGQLVERRPDEVLELLLAVAPGPAHEFAIGSSVQSDPGGAIASPGTGLATASKTLVGWAAGAGWEHAWTDHATFRFEYLYTSFPTTTALGAITDPAGGANTLHGSANLVIQIARVGLNYRF